jgi:hypothetical protein
MYEVVLVIIKVRKVDPVSIYDRKGVLLAKLWKDISLLEQKSIPFNTKDRKALFLFNEI